MGANRTCPRGTPPPPALGPSTTACHTLSAENPDIGGVAAALKGLRGAGHGPCGGRAWRQRGKGRTPEGGTRRRPPQAQEDKEFGLDPVSGLSRACGSPVAAPLCPGACALGSGSGPARVTSSSTPVTSHPPLSRREEEEHSACGRGRGCWGLSITGLSPSRAAAPSGKPPSASDSKARILGPLLDPSANVFCTLRHLNSSLFQGPLSCL